MNRTSLIVEHGVDELRAAGLEALPSRLVRPPRVQGSPVHFECRLHEIVKLPGRTPPVGSPRGDRPRRRRAHRRCRATADGRVDVLKIRPIARLGYKDYTSVESVFEMDKPMPEDRRR